MAAPENLYDAEDLTRTVLADLKEGQDKSGFDSGMVDFMRKRIETSLQGYNRQYHDLRNSYIKSLDEAAESKTSLNKQIDDLKKKVDDAEKRAEESNERNAQYHREEANKIAKIADQEREEMAIEKEKIKNEREQMKVQLEQLGKDVKEAKEDRNAAFKQMEEEQIENRSLRETIERLEKSERAYQEDSRGWRGETERVTDMKDAEKARADAAEAQLRQVTNKNAELSKELAKLKPQLNVAAETMKKQDKTIRELRAMLRTAQEELKREPTPVRQPTPGQSAAKELSGLSRLNSPSPGTPTTPHDAGNAEALEQEKEKNRQLQDDIDSNYVARATHEQALGELKAERDNLQAASSNCQESLKKLQDELAKREKDDHTIRELQAKIRELEKKIEALELETGVSRRELTRQADQIKKLGKQLEASRGRVAKLEQVEQEQQTKIAELRKKVDEAKASSSRSQKKPGHEQELAELRRELQQANDQLENTRDELREVRSELDLQENLLGDVELERDDMLQKVDALQYDVFQRQKVEDALLKTLRETETSRAQIIKAAEAIVQPNGDRTLIGQTFSSRITDLVDVRQEALALYERLIPVTVQAGRSLAGITQDRIPIQGHSTRNNRPYLTDARRFGRSLETLYDRFTSRLGEFQTKIDELKKEAQGNAAAKETADAMQKQLDSLTQRNKQLNELLEECQRHKRLYEDDDAEDGEVIGAIRDEIRDFLRISGPEIGEIYGLLTNLVMHHNRFPGAIPFQAGNEETERALEEANRRLKATGEEFKRLQDTLDELRKNNQGNDVSLAQTTKDLKDCAKERKRLKRELKALEAEKKKTDKSLADANRQYLETEEQRKRLEKELKQKDKLASELSAVKEKLEACKNERKRLQDELQTLRESSSSNDTSVDATREKLEQCKRERTQLQVDLDILRAKMKKNDKARDEANKQLEDCEDERKRLRNEVANLKGEEGGGLTDEERADYENRITRLEAANFELTRENRRLRREPNPDNEDGGDGDGGGSDSSDSDDNDDDGSDSTNSSRGTRLAAANAERQRLEGEVTRLTAENAALQTTVTQLRGSIDELQKQVQDQTNFIAGTGENAGQTQHVLDDQISTINESVRQLQLRIAEMGSAQVHEGRVAAEVSRTLRYARAQVQKYQDLVSQLTMERDLLQDQVRACVQEEKRNRRRLQESIALAHQAAGGDRDGDDDNDVGDGAEPDLEAADGGVIQDDRGVRARLRGFFRRLGARITERTVQNIVIISVLSVLVVVLIVVIVAASRTYDVYTQANVQTRGLYHDMDPRPAIRLHVPYIDFFDEAVLRNTGGAQIVIPVPAQLPI